METKERVQVRVQQYHKPMLFLITFRDNGRYVCSKTFYGVTFKAAVDEAKAWAETLPTYAPADQYAAFDYDYVGH